MSYFSIIIPLYNKEDYIIRALKSVSKQLYPYFEVIVVDDGSTDDGAKLVNKYSDRRIKLIKQPHSGASSARNTGILYAKYNLIAFLDADDEWKSYFLSTILFLYNKYPNAVIFATAYETDLKGERSLKRFKGLPQKEWHGIIKQYFKSVLHDLPIISSAVAIRREVFDTVGFFNQDAQLGEDQDMWTRIALVYPVAYCTKSCACYYLNTKNSVCYNSAIIQKYSVIDIVKNAIKNTEYHSQKKYLQKYLSKLYLDYALKLIISGHFKQALKNIFYSKSKNPIPLSITLYYLIVLFIKSVISGIFNNKIK